MMRLHTTSILLTGALVGGLALSACASDADPTATTGPTDPGPTEPGPTEPGPTEPGPTEPGPTEPGPTEPGPTEPEPTCGDGVVDGDELCDGAALDGASCTSLGYASGQLACRLDCQGLRSDACTFAPSSLVFEATDLGLAIPDDAYDGTIPSMACVDFLVDGAPKFGTTDTASIRLGIDHGWIGDLVVKVVLPSGAVRTLLYRPGREDVVDDGVGVGGSSANLSADHPITFHASGWNADLMGTSLTGQETVCKDDHICEFVAEGGPTPNPEAPEDLNGSWRVCVGDAAGGDAGTIDAITLGLQRASPTPEPRLGRSDVAELGIPDGTFDGELDSMACVPIPVAEDAREVAEVHVNLRIDHPQATDLVIVMLDPEGNPYTLMSRPTVDEGETGSAAASGGHIVLDHSELELVVGNPGPLPSAETLSPNASGEPSCGPGCILAADPGGLRFADPEEMIGHTIGGTWQLCAGDAATGQAGRVEGVEVWFAPSL